MRFDNSHSFVSVNRVCTIVLLIFLRTDDALLRKAFTDILNCCDIHFTYILLHMANLLNE